MLAYTKNLLYLKFKIEFASIINCQNSNCWVLYTHFEEENVLLWHSAVCPPVRHSIHQHSWSLHNLVAVQDIFIKFFKNIYCIKTMFSAKELLSFFS